MAEKLFTPEELAVITEAVGRSKTYADEKSRTISWLMAGVVIVCMIGFVQVIIDSFHINSATYKEYAQKTQAIKSIEESNAVLLNLTKQNQQVILELQGQIRTLMQERKNGTTP